MSTRIIVTALAALATAVSLQGTASARTSSATHASNRAIHRLQASDAFGSIGDQAAPSIGRPSSSVSFGGRTLGQDPDPNVRLELLRDKDLGKT